MRNVWHVHYDDDVVVVVVYGGVCQNVTLIPDNVLL